MHSSKMRTGRSLPYGGGGYRLLFTVVGFSVHGGGLCLGGLCLGGGLCQGDPLPLVDRQTPVKILPFPKLRLRVVNIPYAVATG